MKGKKNKSSLKQIKKMSLTRGTVYSEIAEKLTMTESEVQKILDESE